MQDNVSLLYTEDRIAARVRALSHEIAADLPSDFLMVVVLKGAFVFAADLIRELHELNIHPEVGFITLSSYGSGTTSSGIVRVIGTLPDNIAGRRVLLVDDILDTRRTLAHARDLLLKEGAAEVRLCVLLDKPSRQEVTVTADYVGFTIDDVFVVGYGIDFAEAYRGLPYIGIVQQEDTAEPAPSTERADER